MTPAAPLSYPPPTGRTDALRARGAARFCAEDVPVRDRGRQRLSAGPPLVVLAAAVVALLVALDRLAQSPSRAAGGVDCRVTVVYDGDTVQVDGGWKVRLIGIDALDAHNEEKTRQQARDLGLSQPAVRRWAERAAERARDLADGNRARLEFGPERQDKYGRTLAYLYVESAGEEVLLNRVLLAEGLATAMRAFPHPRLDEFLGLERRARREKAGLWADAAGQ